MRIGYIRIAAGDRTLELQKEALQSADCDDIRIEMATGKSTPRPLLKDCVSRLKQGDTLVVYSINRLENSVAHLLALLAKLIERGITLTCISEGIELSPSSGEVSCLLQALGRYEQSLRLEMRRANQATALKRNQLNGKRFGALTIEEITTAHALLDDEKLPFAQVANEMGISAARLYREVIRKGL